MILHYNHNDLIVNNTGTFEVTIFRWSPYQYTSTPHQLFMRKTRVHLNEMLTTYQMILTLDHGMNRYNHIRLQVFVNIMYFVHVEAMLSRNTLFFPSLIDFIIISRQP